ncbi:AAA domain-containing protein [Alteromonas sp. a30]|nr:AAA domain-containing protein [Alteromonas sp. a30]
MYKREFQASHQFLKQITFDILNNPTKECYQSVLRQWKNEAGFERVLWAVIRRVFAVADPVHLTSIVGDSYLNKLFPLLREHFQIDIKRTNLWLDDNAQLIEKTAPYLPQEIDVITRNILLWYLYEFSVPALQGKKQNGGENRPQQIAENTPQYQDDDNMLSMGLNQILYGPPGTGKTYHTVKLAVDAAEPTFQPEGEGEAQKRKSYKQKYDDLMREGRIRFVTFHQSYGYEEFVEGLSAKTHDGQLSYFEKEGIFKTICYAAEQNLKDSQKSQVELSKEQAFIEALDAFKLSMFDEIDSFPLTESCAILSIEADGFRYGGENWQSSFLMKYEDLKALHLEDVKDRQGVKQSSVVSGLAKQHASYFIRALNEIRAHLPTQTNEKVQVEKQNFVLIIDEINRGNISQIFGELITLIEPSKRAGQNESLQVVLPYSGNPFSVPDNLYLIGTMNTADRSLALMDTALRRRFDFVEMMSDYSKLADDTGTPYCIFQDGKELDLSALLARLNQRITALYDREHTLGHAFFMPVIERIIENDHQAAIQELALCFKNKIIPLLAEYFFEDWEKIRLVLADNQKALRALPTLIEKQSDNIHDLFGESYELEAFDEHIANYQLATDISEQLENALTYIRMYDIRA